MRRFQRPQLLALALAMTAVLVSGCARKFIPTPYVLYGEQGEAVFAETPEAHRTPEIPVIYVTDRSVDEQTDDGPSYGFGRSKSMAYGVATAELDPEVTWEQLVEMSTTGARDRSYDIVVDHVDELGRFGPNVGMFEVMDGRPVATPAAVQALREQNAGLHELINQYLDQTDRKEAVLFIHGFNNDFDAAIVRTAEAWHYGGRIGVPIAFTWPAGAGGLKGYATDRESGEYAVVHLKLLLWALAECPGLEKIHIVSHSRGTDVATTAIRELNAEIRGLNRTSLWVPQAELDRRAGHAEDLVPVYETLKIETLVLAAPDIDIDVFVQRFFGENVLRASNRTVIYFSEDDKALGLAHWLFRGRARLGDVRATDIPPEARNQLEAVTCLELINCHVRGGSSHAYVLQHPAAMSDLLLLLRDDAKAGSAQRPLTKTGPGIWDLDDDYLRPAGAAASNQSTHLYR